MTRAPFEAVIAGYGETGVSKETDRDVVALFADAVRMALESAGLRKDDVDGMTVAGFSLPPDRPINVVEHLGFDLRWFEASEPGGANGITSILHASRAVAAGDAEVVVCCAADVLPTARLRELTAEFSVATRDYLTPFGHGGANGSFALIQRRHMEEYGTTREQLGRVSVNARYHGSLNPQALLREPVTLDDYLGSPPIVEPIHLLDCVHPGSGGAAVVVTAPGRTRAPEVAVLAGAERHNYEPARTSLNFAWEAMRDELFAEVGRDELDAVQLYDDYPIMVAIQLEDLGFCAKGESGPYLERTTLRMDGDLPLNTGGGMLACGQAGAAAGYLAPIEAVRQLRGEGGARQGRDPRRVLASGLGMVGYEVPLSTSAVIFGKD